MVFWFAGFISLAQSIQAAGPCERNSVCGTALTSTVMAVCLWYDDCSPLTSRDEYSQVGSITFLATTVLTTRHMLHTRKERSEMHTPGKQDWVLHRSIEHHLQRWLSQMVLWWKRLIRKVPSWKQTSRKLLSWTEHTLIVNPYTRIQHNKLPTMKTHMRRAYQDLRVHASTLDWPSTTTLAIVFSLYLIFFGLYIHWFKIFIQDLEWFAYNGVDSSSWSFGQIVAISVWAEPLCEYLHLELREFPNIF